MLPEYRVFCFCNVDINRCLRGRNRPIRWLGSLLDNLYKCLSISTHCTEWASQFCKPREKTEIWDSPVFCGRRGIATAQRGAEQTGRTDRSCSQLPKSIANWGTYSRSSFLSRVGSCDADGWAQRKQNNMEDVDALSAGSRKAMLPSMKAICLSCLLLNREQHVRGVFGNAISFKETLKVIKERYPVYGGGAGRIEGSPHIHLSKILATLLWEAT